MNNQFLASISKGIKIGLDECENQFKMSHWNCTPDANTQLLFGSVMERGSREKAYLHAIMSSGIMYSVTKACTSGNLVECGCDHQLSDTRGRFQWGGCSDDVRFGSLFSKNFADSIEDSQTAQGMVNLHNNEVGRRVLKANVETLCKCHGVSGSCTVMICWRKMKPFRVTGEELMRRYAEAVQVRVVEKNGKLKMRMISSNQIVPISSTSGKNIKRKREMRKGLSKKELVYLDESLDYCKSGTEVSGKQCNATSVVPDASSCQNLCCGRGYFKKMRKVEEKCNCKFVWCCKVECEMCSRVKEEYFCK